MAKRKESLIYHIDVSEDVSPKWPGMDWHAYCDLGEHGRAPYIEICVRAPTQEAASASVWKMFNDWERGLRRRAGLPAAELENETCPYEIEIGNDEMFAGRRVYTETPYAIVEFPLPEDNAVGMFHVDLVQPLGFNETQDPEKAVRQRLIRHFNHWKVGSEIRATPDLEPDAIEPDEDPLAGFSFQS